MVRGGPGPGWLLLSALMLRRPAGPGDDGTVWVLGRCGSVR